MVVPSCPSLAQSPKTAGFSSPRRQDERYDSERHSGRKAIVLLALYAPIQ
jgi:hypothetical protein